MADEHVAPAAIEIAAGTPGALRALLGSVPDETIEEPLDEGWSAKDIVAHLLDVEQVAFSDRIRRMISEDRPLITPT